MILATAQIIAASKTWKRFENEDEYYSQGLQPLVFDVGSWLRISFMFWPNRLCVRGMFDRKVDLVFRELGIKRSRADTGPNISSEQGWEQPDVLVLQNGIWDVQDRPASHCTRGVQQILRLTQKWLPRSQVVMMGPLQTYVEGKKSWRTTYRLVEHSIYVARVTKLLQVGLQSNIQVSNHQEYNMPTVLKDISMYSSINCERDQRHYQLHFYTHVFNLLLNEIGRLAFERQSRQLFSMQHELDNSLVRNLSCIISGTT